MKQGNTEFMKRQYAKRLELWKEKAVEEISIYCREHDIDMSIDTIEQFYGHLAEDRELAYNRGVDGLTEPDTISALKMASENEPPFGQEFFDRICDMIRESYEEGKGQLEQDI